MATRDTHAAPDAGSGHTGGAGANGNGAINDNNVDRVAAEELSEVHVPESEPDAFAEPVDVVEPLANMGPGSPEACPPRGRRSGRDGRMARVARLRAREQGPGAGAATCSRVLEEAAYLAAASRLPFTATTPYINTIPRRQAAALSRQPRDRAAHQEHHPLERDGDGRAGQPRRRRASAATSRRTPRRPRCTKWPSTTSSAAEARWLRRRPDLLPGPRLARHLLAGVSRRPADRDSTSSNFRRELAAGGGLSSYPHPWLMPDFWEFPTVSMGLGPIMAIYQARFNRYLHDRGIKRHARARTCGRSSATANATSRKRSARSRWPRARSSTT